MFALWHLLIEDLLDSICCCSDFWLVVLFGLNDIWRILNRTELHFIHIHRLVFLSAICKVVACFFLLRLFNLFQLIVEIFLDRSFYLTTWRIPFADQTQFRIIVWVSSSWPLNSIAAYGVSLSPSRLLSFLALIIICK